MFVAISEISNTLEDITKYTKKFGESSKQVDFLTGDKLFLGSNLKFNHAFISYVTAAVSSGLFKLSLYDGSTFIEVGRTTDETDGFTTEGVIEFAPKADTSWSKADTMDITELATVQYLNLYWLVIEFENDCSFDIDFIGHRFSNDFDLFSEHPELNNAAFLSQFSQTNFTKQATLAATLIEKALIKNGYADSNNQVLEYDDLTLPSVSKVAQLIYTSFGPSYVEKVDSLKGEFSSRVNSSFPLVDNNNTAEKSTNKALTQGRLYR